MYADNYFYNTYYIKAGKGTFYIKCFESGQWIRCKSEIEVDNNGHIQKVHINSSNLDQAGKKPLQVATKRINPFNHSRTVLHHFELAERFIRYLIRKFKTGWWVSTGVVIFRLDYSPDGGITDVELKAIRELLERSGARDTYIIKPDISVSEHKVDALYQQLC
jgi:actin-like ATPase involved in cell morphogenesis